MPDEEVHPRLPALADDESDQYGRISDDYHREQDPEYRELLRLKGWENYGN